MYIDPCGVAIFGKVFRNMAVFFCENCNYLGSYFKLLTYIMSSEDVVMNLKGHNIELFFLFLS